MPAEAIHPPCSRHGAEPAAEVSVLAHIRDRPLPAAPGFRHTVKPGGGGGDAIDKRRRRGEGGGDRGEGRVGYANSGEFPAQTKTQGALPSASSHPPAPTSPFPSPTPEHRLFLGTHR